MPPKIVTSLKEQAERLLRVRQPETVVVELLVTATREAEDGLRDWVAQQGIDVEPAPHQDTGGVASLRLRQIRVLEGRAGSSVSHEVVSAWVDAL